MAETSGEFCSGLAEAIPKNVGASVIAATTPRTPTKSETTFERDCIRRLVVVFAHDHAKRAKSLSM